ncbi:MAG: hypothetical protein M1538_02265 [Candidatus Marsarchaeota archaeon]|jgi:hypothetical protein|nr:hypothetical protein [Cyanobacteriota bacterium]MCL5433782.1 hypothetical protein [Candidatus Marsarchaeota archaeon]
MGKRDNGDNKKLDLVEEDFENEVKLNQLYLSIISKYKDYIEQKEQKSLSELPSLIIPTNEIIMAKVNSIKLHFQNYNYNKDFYKASILAFDFVKDNIKSITMPIKYWLTPDETILFGFGDIIDKNVLLTSLLIALGNHSTKVLIIEEFNIEKIYTYCEYKNNIILFNVENDIKIYKNLKSVLKNLNLNDDVNIYAFNNLGSNTI